MSRRCHDRERYCAGIYEFEPTYRTLDMMMASAMVGMGALTMGLRRQAPHGWCGRWRVEPACQGGASP